MYSGSLASGLYDPLLVVLSVAIAMFASYTALDLANSVTMARGRARLLWLAGGSLAMGVGVWSMHFIGMLAFRLPDVPIAYDVPRMALSIVVAISASALALHAVSRRVVRRARLGGASLAMGAAIAGMHYIGIWSMRMAAGVQWRVEFIALSIAIAVSASFAALLLAVRFRTEPSRRPVLPRLSAAGVMGVAIAGMHYTAMAAMTFFPLAERLAITGGDVLGTPALGVAVTGMSSIILTIAVVGSVVERELVRRTSLADEAAAARDQARSAAWNFEFLAAASSALASSLDYQRTLAGIARLAVPRVADWCLVDLVEESDGIARVAVAHRDPAKERLAQELARRYRPTADAPSPGPSVLRTGEPLHLPEVGDPELNATTVDAEHAALLRSLGTRSIIAAPLVARGHALGALTFVMGDSGRRYDADDLALISELARRVALAVDNARLYRAAVVANQAKSDFLAVVSHELRTPLNAIIGYAELMDLEIGGKLSDAHRKEVHRIRASSQHLLDLIEDILAFSRADASQEQLRIEAADLSAIIGEVAATTEPLAREKRLAFNVSAPAAPAPIETDVRKLRQILLNLLSNAVKFTDEGEIELHARRDDDELVLEVRDTGIGIPREHQERVFNPFWQVEQARTRRVGGTGLGLSVARRFARLMGGDVTVETAPGQGSTFTVRLPLGPPTERPDA